MPTCEHFLRNFSSTGSSVSVMGAMRLQMSRRRFHTHVLFGTVQIVKQRLEKERDLEGIDMGNIVSGGRRSRTGNTASVNYK